MPAVLPVTLTVKVHVAVPAVMLAPVSVTLAGLVALKASEVAEQPAPAIAVTLLIVSPAPAVRVSVKLMLLCAGWPAPLVSVKVKTEVPVATTLAGA